MGPCGLGIVPSAQDSEPNAGANRKVVKPVAVGLTPSTARCSQTAGPADQP